MPPPKKLTILLQILLELLVDPPELDVEVDLPPPPELTGVKPPDFTAV